MNHSTIKALTTHNKAAALWADFIAAHDRLGALQDEALAIYEAGGDVAPELMKAIDTANSFVAAAYRAWERELSRLDRLDEQAVVEAAERLAVPAITN